MGAEFIAGSLEELCDLMCNNVIPKRREKMIKAKMNIKGCPTPLLRGFEVLTLVDGCLWHYGLYPDEDSAQAAVDENPEMRIMVEVAE